MSTSHARCLELISQKDRRINELELELASVQARTTRLQRRLLLTLDALDALQISHEQELQAESLARSKMEEMLPRQTRLMQKLEADRDRLRETVSVLLKGASLPDDEMVRSHVQASYSLDPSSRTGSKPSSPLPDNERAMHASLVRSLRAEQDAERAAHKKTVRDAESIISSLKAQLAFKESELEASISVIGMPTSASTPRRRSTFKPKSRSTTPVMKDAPPVRPSKPRGASPIAVPKASVYDDDTENDTLTALDHDLETLNTKINEFTLERSNVVKMVADCNSISKLGVPATPIKTPTSKLTTNKQSSPVSERAPTPFPRARALRATLESDDTDSGGERPMELETPLQGHLSFVSSSFGDEGRPLSPSSPSSAVTSPTMTAAQPEPLRKVIRDDVFWVS